MRLCCILDASGLLRAVTQFSHLAADTIVNAAATSHSAPTDQADRERRTPLCRCAGYIIHKPWTLPPVALSHAGLTDSSRDCANNCLQFLKDLKLQATLPRADPSAVRYTIQRIHGLGEVKSGIFKLLLWETWTLWQTISLVNSRPKCCLTDILVSNCSAGFANCVFLCLGIASQRAGCAPGGAGICGG